MQAQADALPPGIWRPTRSAKDGGIVPIARYTPFGAFTSLGRDGKVAADAVLDPLLPQLSTARSCATARTRSAATWQDARRVGSGEAHGAGGYSMLEAFLPFAQVARRLREKGSTGYSDSTFWAPKTKPNTSYGRSAVGRIFNPFEPTYLKGPIKGGEAAAAPARAAAPVGRSAAGEARGELRRRLKVTAEDPRMKRSSRRSRPPPGGRGNL
jgi:hypothetical protein